MFAFKINHCLRAAFEIHFLIIEVPYGYDLQQYGTNFRTFWLILILVLFAVLLSAYCSYSICPYG
jgi:hypothetical protein